MPEFCVFLGCVLAVWKFVELVLGAWRKIRCACCAVGGSVRGIGAWWRRKAVRVAQVRYHKDNGLHHVQAETIALLTAQIANMQAKMDVLVTQQNTLSLFTGTAAVHKP